MQQAKAPHNSVQPHAETRQNKGAAQESPQGEHIAQLEAMADASPAMAAQRKLIGMIHNSPAMAAQRKAIDGIHGNAPAQREEVSAKPNHTGLPDNLKTGIESLSGLSMDNVKVHYNSSQPAQLNALAYAQGTDIHVAPGQEQHLPHEAWHVVQQAQGRVKPTMQMKDGVPVNDDKGLEREADAMGEKAAVARVMQEKSIELDPLNSWGRKGSVAQGKLVSAGKHGNVWVPDSINLQPDKPVYGGTAQVGSGLLAYPAATSMEALITPGHPMGSEPKALDALFDGLPTKGKYDMKANQSFPRNGSTLYIKGHLLNDNLGGPGTDKNLYPITHQANVDHDQKIEEPIKDHVNKEGGAVHYQVQVSKQGEGNTALFYDESKSKPLKYVNADYVCTISEFGSDHSTNTHSETIRSVWGGTDNSGANKLSMLADGAHGVASSFDASAVNVMPRAVKGKDKWDKALEELARHLAEMAKSKMNEWLSKNIKGIGKVGAELISSSKSYESLGKSQKGTLTSARRLLKAYLEQNYGSYLHVEGGGDVSDVSVPDQGKTTVIDNTGSQSSVTGTPVVTEPQDPMDELINAFANMSLGPPPNFIVGPAILGPELFATPNTSVVANLYVYPEEAYLELATYSKGTISNRTVNVSDAFRVLVTLTPLGRLKIVEGLPYILNILLYNLHSLASDIGGGEE